MRWMSRQQQPRVLRCRDGARHARHLAARPHVDQDGPGVELDVDGVGVLVLQPLVVGALRDELRAALLAAGEQHNQRGERQ